MDSLLLSQYLFSGLVIGVIYALMAVGITFIYSIMKMINWSMGEFYMIGSYIQYLLIIYLLGAEYWYVGIPLAMVLVFLLGMVVQRLLLTPMYSGGIERRNEYATIVTIGLMVFFRNLAVVLAGPYQYSPPDYYPPTYIGTLPVSGNRFVAFIGTLVILLAFYLVIKKTWVGKALRGAAQNRVGIQTPGRNIQRRDPLPSWRGVALAAAAGALLAPIFLVYPENGAISTMKGFEIIVIGGLGSIPGSIVGGLLLGMVESLGSVLVSPSFRDVYGFLLLLILLVCRPTGLLGERERVA
ncbi:MAG: branched-chain amino acid ABC transporter permease [Nitrospinota bacterium]|nr:MAG: branched-chain amino acid ABC transporter permease [Nitrospinota bacterium]